jgi:hypothetical protein
MRLDRNQSPDYKVLLALPNETTKNLDKKPTTLKVFMAPEFFYRGKGGAYIHDLINGWKGPTPAEFAVSGHDNFRGLFGNLDVFSFSDWLFVFGTAISASFPAKNVNGKWHLDATRMGEIYNTALIQPVRPSDAYASRKHYKSGIDFINDSYRSTGFTLGTVEVADPENLEPGESDREGSATFKINGINDKGGQPIMFGLEVCLDHAQSTGSNDTRNAWGRIRTADKWVKIQLVPSGGMILNPASIRLLPPEGPTPHSYAFNCDGLTTLEGQWGAHTQIWNGANGRSPVPLENQLINANYGQRLSNTTAVKVSNQSDYARDIGIDAYQLWDLGSGYVRVMQPMPL